MKQKIFFILPALYLLLFGCFGKPHGTHQEDTSHKASLQTAEQPSPDIAPHSDNKKASLKTQDTRIDAIQQLWNGAVCSNPDEAIHQLNSLLQETPDNVQALALRGLARSQISGQREEAFEDITAAVLRSPTARHYAWRGLASLRGGNARGAHNDAQYALRKDPKDPVALMVTGLLAQEQGRTQEACDALRKACQGGECSGMEAAQTHNFCPR